MGVAIRAPPPPLYARRGFSAQLCGFTFTLKSLSCRMLSFTCAKEDTLFLHVLLLAMERRWLLSVAYLHLCLLCSSVGQTPDNNEGQYSNYNELNILSCACVFNLFAYTAVFLLSSAWRRRAVIVYIVWLYCGFMKPLRQAQLASSAYMLELVSF